MLSQLFVFHKSENKTLIYYVTLEVCNRKLVGKDHLSRYPGISDVMNDEQ